MISVLPGLLEFRDGALCREAEARTFQSKCNVVEHAEDQHEDSGGPSQPNGDRTVCQVGHEVSTHAPRVPNNSAVICHSISSSRCRIGGYDRVVIFLYSNMNSRLRSSLLDSLPDHQSFEERATAWAVSRRYHRRHRESQMRGSNAVDEVLKIS